MRRMLLLFTALTASLAHAQEPPSRVQLGRTQRGEFPSKTDSNSPHFWADGKLHVLNSWGGVPILSVGEDFRSLRVVGEPDFGGGRNGGRWMEAVVPGPGGVLYGYYHNEPQFIGDSSDPVTTMCPGSKKTAPRIGAAVSRDNGRTWVDQGIILEAPLSTIQCSSANYYFVGGLGDVSAILDRDEKYVYFFFGNYAGALDTDHGVSVARMPWAEREEPVGKVVKWNGAWNSEGLGGWARPIFPAEVSFHKPNARGLWGPQIHWNTHLERYVMVMNKAKDSSKAWSQEGAYITFVDRLEEPRAWSQPYAIVKGGTWYPEIVSFAPGWGTDRLVGQTAALFMGGKLVYSVIFFRPGETRYCPPEGSAVRCR